MSKYYWDTESQTFVDQPARDYRTPMGIMIQRDLPAYRSPLGNYMVEGRSARREDLKRNNCREVDPSEFKPQWRSKAEKARIAQEQSASRAASSALSDALNKGITNIKE